MAEQVALTFAEADLGKPPEDEDGPIEELEPQRSIAVIQAGTGVGKSMAYSVPAVALALARNTRVMISTATVALQEQLVQGPAGVGGQPAAAVSLRAGQGRGRYVCKLKLDRWAHGADEADGDAAWGRRGRPVRRRGRAYQRRPIRAWRRSRPSGASSIRIWRSSSTRGRWDGDRDQLAQPPEGSWWAAVAAEGSAALRATARPATSAATLRGAQDAGRRAGDRGQPRPAAKRAGSRMLPELDNCLLVLDEAHHLPGIALDQFASSMDPEPPEVDRQARQPGGAHRRPAGGIRGGRDSAHFGSAASAYA